MERTVNVKRGLTHAGKFHADDVFSTAFLSIIFPGIEIERANTVPNGYDGIVFDIGGGRFDHHMKDRRTRDNGIPYAAFGLLWEEFGNLVMNDTAKAEFDENFIQPLDLSDNIGSDNAISQIISAYNPNWDEEKDVNTCFQEAVALAKGILEHNFAKAKSRETADRLVKEEIRKQGGKVLKLDRYMPWHDSAIGEETEVVIYPSLRGGYNVELVRQDRDASLYKVNFPKAWYGLSGRELQKASGIDGISFCHATGFLVATDTLEAAMKIAEMVA